MLSSWKVYRIINFGGYGNVFLINFLRIFEIVVDYICLFENFDLKFVIVFEGFEYFKFYNDFRVIVKFLIFLWDYVVVSNGIFVFVLEKDVWEEREMKMLERFFM